VPEQLPQGLLFRIPPPTCIISRRQYSTHPVSPMDDDNIIPYQTSPTLTVKQAVMYILGYRDEYSFKADTEVITFDLFDYLYHLQEEADCAFGNASYELEMLKREGNASPEAIKSAEEKVESTKAELKKANELPKLAEQYRLQINHEISRARLGKRNSLVIDEDETADTGQLRINTASFQEWLDEIQLDDDTSDSMPVKLPLVDEALDQAIEKTSKPIENLFLTLGLLVSLYAESQGNDFGSGQNPKVSKVAEAIANYAKDRNDKYTVKGQGHERIKDRIEVAQSVLKTTI